MRLPKIFSKYLHKNAFCQGKKDTENLWKEKSSFLPECAVEANRKKLDMWLAFQQNYGVVEWCGFDAPAVTHPTFRRLKQAALNSEALSAGYGAQFRKNL